MRYCVDGLTKDDKVENLDQFFFSIMLFLIDAQIEGKYQFLPCFVIIKKGEIVEPKVANIQVFSRFDDVQNGS